MLKQRSVSALTERQLQTAFYAPFVCPPSCWWSVWVHKPVFAALSEIQIAQQIALVCLFVLESKPEVDYLVIILSAEQECLLAHKLC